MPLNDLTGKAVLITGGTMGIGHATALAFARQGARCILTHKWGAAEEEDVLAPFRAEGLPLPLLVQADAADEDDTDALLDRIAEEHESIEVFISNVAFALIIEKLDDYSLRALNKGIEYSAWPFYQYTTKIRAKFGKLPRYVVGLSSDGIDSYFHKYDFVASAKAVMETLCRYMNYRLFDEDIRLNVLRSRFIATESLRATFGEEFEVFADQFNYGDKIIGAEEVADATLALCSGLMDGVSGQTLMLDRGTAFSDNLMGFYSERDQLQVDLSPRDSNG